MTIILTLSFILMATIACLVFIQSNTNPILKTGLIIVTIWYGIALWFLPNYFMGFPKQIDELPNAWVLTYKIIEPSGTDKGGMHFWVIEDLDDKELNRLNPMDTFRIINRKIPRAYTIPYNRELHKQLEKAVKKGRKKGGRGGLLRYKKDDDFLEAGKERGTSGKFQVINPAFLLPPKG